MRYYWLRHSLAFLRKQSQVPSTGFSSYRKKASNSQGELEARQHCLVSPLERCISVSNITFRNTFRILAWRSLGHPISSCLSELAAPFPQMPWGKHTRTLKWLRADFHTCHAGSCRWSLMHKWTGSAEIKDENFLIAFNELLWFWNLFNSSAIFY